MTFWMKTFFIEAQLFFFLDRIDSVQNIVVVKQDIIISFFFTLHPNTTF